jgi:ribosomal protein S18 acetylase RimI-like enzyme
MSLLVAGHEAPGGRTARRSRTDARAEIEDLKVDRAHRRKGLGRALAMEALRWIENAAVRMIRAHVGNDNLAAVRLFERIGVEQDQVTLNRGPF